MHHGAYFLNEHFRNMFVFVNVVVSPWVRVLTSAPLRAIADSVAVRLTFSRNDSLSFDVRKSNTTRGNLHVSAERA